MGTEGATRLAGAKVTETETSQEKATTADERKIGAKIDGRGSSVNVSPFVGIKNELFVAF